MRNPFTQIYVHYVWATWDRLPTLGPDIEGPIYAAILHKIDELQCFPVTIGGDYDHVHLLVRLCPAVSVAQLVGETKGCSAHLVNACYSRTPRFAWQGAYGAFSVSPGAIEKVAAYIQNQKQHHAEKNLHQEWERIFLPDDWVWRENRENSGE